MNAKFENLTITVLESMFASTGMQICYQAICSRVQGGEGGLGGFCHPPTPPHLTPLVLNLPKRPVLSRFENKDSFPVTFNVVDHFVSLL